MSAPNPFNNILRRLQGKKTPPAVELKDKPDTRKKAPESVIINQVTVRPIRRESQDIQKWRQALIYAESEHDQRWKLYELYQDMLLDGFMLRQKEKRIEAITNCDLTFTVDGEAIPEIEELQNKIFFHDFLREAMETKFWGHTLVELYWPTMGSEDPGRTFLIPREHVKPRFGIVTKERSDAVGIPYREAPYNKHVIEIGKETDLGLYLPVAPYVIYKRGNFGDWAEFAEVFGMPFRWATYNNESSRAVLEEALSKAGSAGYVVAPEDANMQFFNATAGSQSNDIFRFLRNACNEEISITILGNSMTTTEAAKSGYAQAETHRDTQDEVHKADRRWILRVLNEKLMPYLESLGYPVKGGHWSYEEEDGLDLIQRLNVDMQVSAKVPIPDDYWYDKYKIPKPSPEESAKKKAQVKTSPEPSNSPNSTTPKGADAKNA